MEKSRHQRVIMTKRTTEIVITRRGTLELIAGLWSEEARLERATVTEKLPATMYEYHASFIIHLTRFECSGRFPFRKPRSDTGPDRHIQTNILILIRR